ncbi:DUF2500 domain-containing protein [Paenibacillus pini]|uniref:DUF2500 domain-containing protein n=1 Tax=Paenibacillus pini TaxID=669461 RepID=UPI00068D5360|nr:DUF2500 domain-containing protein [Paenibacillus pini]
MTLIYVLIGIVVVVALVIFLVILLITNADMKNGKLPLIKRNCTIVDKRTEAHGGSNDSSLSNYHYLTCEFDDHSRQEVYVRPSEYGLIIVGDKAILTVQGTRVEIERVI